MAWGREKEDAGSEATSERRDTAKEMAVGGQGVTWPRRGPDTGKASRVPGGADTVADKQGRAKASPSACFLFSPQWAWGAVKGQGVYLAERRGGV